MSAFDVIALLAAATAICGYVNFRWLRLPDLIGTTAVALLAALASMLLESRWPAVATWGRQAMRPLDFQHLILQGLLGPLLFAGSLQLDFAALARMKWIVIALATVGVALSAALIGGGLYYGAPLIGMRVPLIDCLLFGALLSPTDPLATLALLGKAGVPALLRTKIAGEALFNDGTGVALFVTLLRGAEGGTASVGAVLLLFLQQVVGGIAYGVVVGYLGVLLLRRVDRHSIEIMVTLAMCTAGYAAADRLGVSAVIATVVMGLIIGGRAREYAMSARTRERLFTFWELIDELLNLLLFALLGLEIVAIADSVRVYFWPALLVLPLALGARWISVALPISALRIYARFEPHTITLLTWAGLRGALSVALALSLPAAHSKDLLVTATYVCALFSILVQATTVERLARRCVLGVPPPASAR